MLNENGTCFLFSYSYVIIYQVQSNKFSSKPFLMCMISRLYNYALDSLGMINK